LGRIHRGGRKVLARAPPPDTPRVGPMSARRLPRGRRGRLLPWMFAPVAVCCLVLAPTSVAAQSIWEHAKQVPHDEEREVQAAIERVLLGYGDERDLLRVRVALITLSRGEVSDPRSIVWLVRLRREMGLMPAVVSERLLREALRSRLSATERGWAYLELSHLAL